MTRTTDRPAPRPPASGCPRPEPRATDPTRVGAARGGPRAAPLARQPGDLAAGERYQRLPPARAKPGQRGRLRPGVRGLATGVPGSHLPGVPDAGLPGPAGSALLGLRLGSDGGLRGQHRLRAWHPGAPARARPAASEPRGEPGRAGSVRDPRRLEREPDDRVALHVPLHGARADGRPRLARCVRGGRGELRPLAGRCALRPPDRRGGPAARPEPDLPHPAGAAGGRARRS